MTDLRRVRSAEFRRLYPILEERVAVTANGHVIGYWLPASVAEPIVQPARTPTTSAPDPLRPRPAVATPAGVAVRVIAPLPTPEPAAAPVDGVPWTAAQRSHEAHRILERAAGAKAPRKPSPKSRIGR